MSIDSLICIRNGNVIEGVDMIAEEYLSNPLWSVLVETVHVMVMYPHHKAYVRDVVLHEQPDITATDLAVKLGIPSGEALVILHDLRNRNERAQG